MYYDVIDSNEASRSTASRLAEGLLLLACVTAVFTISQLSQPPAQHPIGDEVSYWAMYEHFAGRPGADIYYPYHNRILVPFLASLVPLASVVQSFVLLNFLFAGLGILTLHAVWRRSGVPTYLVWLSLLWLLTHWMGIVRFYVLFPLLVDVSAYFFQALLIYILIRRRYSALVWLAPIATLQRESFLVILVVLVAYEGIARIFRGAVLPLHTLAFSLALAMLCKLTANAIILPATASTPPFDSIVGTISHNLLLTINDPYRLVRWIVAGFIGYAGPALLALQTLWRRRPIRALHETVTRSFNPELVHVLTLVCVVQLGLGLVAGSDTTRILFLGFPFYMTLVLIIIRGLNRKLVVGSFVFSLPLLRLTSPLPVISSDRRGYMAWFPEYAQPEAVSQLALYMLGLFLLLLLLHRVPGFEKRTPASAC